MHHPHVILAQGLARQVLSAESERCDAERRHGFDTRKSSVRLADDAGVADPNWPVRERFSTSKGRILCYRR